MIPFDNTANNEWLFREHGKHHRTLEQETPHCLPLAVRILVGQRVTVESGSPSIGCQNGTGCYTLIKLKFPVLSLCS